ncbi:POTRA domain-containing protein [Parasediminibacterium sp. JCM 36343]|uniref:POTRA domain-containing protein n=1 Tax=Parasediminibacterium sp. JCM 36343 TaxID=3374279 RepID=UPI00397A6437
MAQTHITDILPPFAPIADSSLPKTDGVLIADIIIKGNKRTKPYIILREMTLKKGDLISASALSKQIEISRNQVFNTALFIDVAITVTSKLGDIITLKIDVKERWYFFPVPYFKLADRNFNQWWQNENHSLDRVNFGLKFTQYNLSGNNDGLDVWLITGYSRQLKLRYNLPFFEKTLKHGLNVGYGYTTQKEVNDSTSFDKQIFLKSARFIRTFNRLDVSYAYRPDQHWAHFVTVALTNEWLADSVVKAAPNYFPQRRGDIQYLDFSYSFRYQNLDYFAYPTKGYTYEGYIYKRGLDEVTNLWQVGLSGLYAHPVWKKAFVKFSAAATFKRPNTNYFFNKRLFGYNDFALRGLEYYVVDGDKGVLARATLLQEVLKYKFNTHLHSKTYDKIPFRYYLKIYADAGYAHNTFAGNSILANKLMYTYGIGLDVVSIYDFVFRFELSFNQLGTQGLYLHTK